MTKSEREILLRHYEEATFVSCRSYGMYKHGLYTYDDWRHDANTASVMYKTCIDLVKPKYLDVAQETARMRAFRFFDSLGESFKDARDAVSRRY